MTARLTRLIPPALLISILLPLWQETVIAATVTTSGRVVDAVTIRERPTTQSPVVGRMTAVERK